LGRLGYCDSLFFLFAKEYAMFRRHKSASNGRPMSFRPALEGLEERQLLSSFTELPLPASFSLPVGITTGADGRIWFTEEQTNKIGRVNAGNSITEFQVPTPNSDPFGITKGPDGNIWFTELTGNKIGRVNANGTISEFQVPTAKSGPVGITAGPDGNVWFTESNGDKLGRVNPNGSITEFNVPNSNNIGPNGITTGPDRNIWFTFGFNGVGRLNADGSVTEFRTANTLSGTQGITTGPDGHIWFTEYVAGEIGRVNANGSISEFAIPVENSFAGTAPGAIETGPDGNLWITDAFGNRLVRGNLAANDASVTFTSFDVPTPNGTPRGITTGADGKLWFTEQLGNKVASFTIPRLILPPLPFQIGLLSAQDSGGQAAIAPGTGSAPVNEASSNLDAVFAGNISSGMQSAVDAVAAAVHQPKTSVPESLEMNLGDVLISG
jgi:streptogramin lyase